MLAWFLQIAFVQGVGVIVYVYVCVSPPLIAGGTTWSTYYWLNKFYNFYYIAVIVSTVSRRGLRLETCHRNQPNKSKGALYKWLFSHKWLFKTVVHK